jgi:hypothetical protein
MGKAVQNYIPVVDNSRDRPCDETLVLLAQHHVQSAKDLERTLGEKTRNDGPLTFCRKTPRTLTIDYAMKKFQNVPSLSTFAIIHAKMRRCATSNFLKI